LGLSPIFVPLSYSPFIFKLASQGTIGSPAFGLDLRSISDPTGMYMGSRLRISGSLSD
jgi:hypothetical protein